MRITAGARIDHRAAVPHDSARFQLTGIPLPSFQLPGLPFRLEPGIGSSGLVFSMQGDRIAARWNLRTTQAAWQVDSAGARPLTTVDRLIWRVLSGLRLLDVTAELSGTVQSPRFSVRSNLDQAIADRVRGLLGEEIRAAEARVRAQVDQLVSGRVAQGRAHADTVSGELRARVASVREELDLARTQLESRLKTLTGGLGGVLGM